MLITCCGLYFTEGNEKVLGKRESEMENRLEKLCELFPRSCAFIYSNKERNFSPSNKV